MFLISYCFSLNSKHCLKSFLTQVFLTPRFPLRFVVTWQRDVSKVVIAIGREPANFLLVFKLLLACKRNTLLRLFFISANRFVCLWTVNNYLECSYFISWKCSSEIKLLRAFKSFRPTYTFFLMYTRLLVDNMPSLCIFSVKLKMPFRTCPC